VNERLTELYRSCRPKEALASQDEYKSANVLLGTEVEKFAELIVRECGVALSPMLRDMVSRGQAFDLIKEHFGVEE